MPTFVMTDVVRSDELWDADPEAMARAVDLLHEQMTTVVGRSSGTMDRPRGESESYLITFDDAASAIVFVVDLMSALGSQTWPTGAHLDARAAVHTGPAEFRNDNWYGQALNRCARLRAALHPGQAAANEAAVEEARGRLPASVSLLDLGTVTLRDISLEGRVFQICAPGMLDHAMSLRTWPSGIDEPMTSFVGRRTEVDQIGDVLTAHGRVWVWGAPGVGKSRVAIEVAAERAAGDGGVPYRIDLAAPSIPADATLLVIDDSDHDMEQVMDLLERSDIPAIVTARCAPEFGCHGVRIGPLSGAAAVRLFRERARAVVASFDAPDEMLAELCHALGRLPLALELAALRVAVLPVPALSKRARSDVLRLLPVQEGRQPTHHRSWSEAIEWSMHALDAETRASVVALARSEAIGAEARGRVTSIGLLEPGATSMLGPIASAVIRSLNDE